MTILNKKEAAEILRISTVTLDRIRKSGKLPHRKFSGQIRFTMDDINAYIASTATVGIGNKNEASK